MNTDDREPVVISFHDEEDSIVLSTNRTKFFWHMTLEEAQAIADILHATEPCSKKLRFATFHSPDGFEVAHDEYDTVSITYRIDNLSEARTSLIGLLTRRGMRSTPDKINHPSHYGGGDNPYETIKVIRAWKLDFSLGNAVKYISRAGKKDGESTVDDLKKALWYIQNKIDELEQG